MLTNKRILLISPQPWNGLQLSKHHYAESMAARGNLVFFLEPLTKKWSSSIITKKCNHHPDIFIITAGSLFPYNFRFHLPLVFQLFLRILVHRIKKRFGPFDIVWDFDCNHLFHSFSAWNASLHIMHPMDAGSTMPPAKKADFIFSPSPEILHTLQAKNCPSFIIPHGLCPEFEELGRMQLLQNTNQTDSKGIHVGYYGNICHHAIDKKIFCAIIRQNPEITFHLVGNHETQTDSNAGYFIQFLKSQPNVILYGVQNKHWLCQHAIGMHLFLACYKKSKEYAGDNSHKILEYLATGKPVISNNLTFYKNKKLLIMPEEDQCECFPNLFRRSIQNLKFYNSPKFRKKRILFALQHTYSSNLEKIEHLIKSHA